MKAPYAYETTENPHPAAGRREDAWPGGRAAREGSLEEVGREQIGRTAGGHFRWAMNSTPRPAGERHGDGVWGPEHLWVQEE